MAKRPAKWPHQRQSVAGKVAVITGGTRGIGRATAMLLAGEGARVLVAGRSKEPLDETLAACRELGEIVGVQADLTRRQDIDRLFAAADELGPADILINNVGLPISSVFHGDYADWEYAVKANLLSYLACARAAIDRMAPRNTGHIVNIGSMSASVREIDSGVYVATKSAIRGWSESLRKTCNRDGVRVTLIEPGSVDTSFHPATREQRDQEIARGERLTSEDIAELIFYCLTQPARCDLIAVQVRPHHQYI